MADTSLTPIDYTSRDYTSLRSDLIAAIPEYLPEWTNRSENDFGIVLLELFSYVGDMLSFYTDRVANEAYIQTAVQRSSVLAIAEMLDYRPSGRAAAAATLTFTISASAGGPVTIPAGTQVSTVPATTSEDPIVFETSASTVINPGVSGNVAAAEGVTREEDSISPVGVSDGASDQEFPLFYTTIIDGSVRIFVDEDGAGAGSAAEWRYFAHLLDAGSEDRAFSLYTDENDVTYVVFGDNANGRIPPAGAIVTAEYRTGVGAKGNVGAGTLTELVSPIAGVETVANASAATGGADAESLASIRKNAPKSLTTLERAVTTEDYATLARRVSGILHAQASATVFTNVTLYVAPQGGGAPSTALKNAVSDYLATRKMIGTSITVSDPTYVNINVTVNPLNVLPQYKRTSVQTAVSNAIKTALAVENVDFAERVTLSTIYQAIQSVEGVDYGVVTVLSTTGSGLADVVTTAGQIPQAGTITVSATGGLTGT